MTNCAKSNKNIDFLTLVQLYRKGTLLWLPAQNYNSPSKKAPCINETNYITVYIKFLALKK